ncbi:MAG: hypothetical protein RTU92_05865 [Candidatus Thorarchaeota archaeon]
MIDDERPLGFWMILLALMMKILFYSSMILLNLMTIHSGMDLTIPYIAGYVVSIFWIILIISMLLRRNEFSVTLTAILVLFDGTMLFVDSMFNVFKLILWIIGFVLSLIALIVFRTHEMRVYLRIGKE